MNVAGIDPTTVDPRKYAGFIASLENEYCAFVQQYGNKGKRLVCRFGGITTDDLWAYEIGLNSKQSFLKALSFALPRAKAELTTITTTKETETMAGIITTPQAGTNGTVTEMPAPKLTGPKSKPKRTQGNKAFGKRLAAMMKQRRCSATRLSVLIEDLGGSATIETITSWMKGDTLPHIYNISALASALGTDPNTLLGWNTDGE